jgi:hypothetical protein
MKVKRYVLATAAVLAVGAGGGAAIAASGGDDRKQAEQSVIDDAAKRLNVTPEALRSALGAAQDGQLDQAVKDGKLTQDQADAIKERRAKGGSVLGGPGAGGPHGGRGGPGFGPGHGGPGHGGPGHGGPRLMFKLGPGGALDAAASALGLDRAQLITKLRDGRSIADVAKDQNKSLDDVKKAITNGVTKDLDEAVKDKQLTSEQRDKVLERLGAQLDDLVTRTPPTAGPRFEQRDHGAGASRHWR